MTMYEAKTKSPLEAAYAAAMNARDNAVDRFQAMDMVHAALDLVGKCSHSDGYLVRTGPIAQAKEKWDI
jgi:hypothetical protein